MAMTRSLGILALALLLAGLARTGGSRATPALTRPLRSPCPRRCRVLPRVRQGAGLLRGDPDRWKNPSGNFLRAAESPDHFLDMEHLNGKEPPNDRYQAVATCTAERSAGQGRPATLRRSMENFDRLCTVAFYDYREETNNAAVQKKCLVLRGGCWPTTRATRVMPLHTTLRLRRQQPGPGRQHAARRGSTRRWTASRRSTGLKAEEVAAGPGGGEDRRRVGYT